ncbi:hypothetical protein L873DRAFT_132313 [Choiromyces venosus 120613-1]|uniref:Uncharacterized protein n=1 Tax=Choiromyces venosus 120613-1 TaxID=1336337 RepID=A0A3N4J3V0_9PEZI|nr:hypothetical protein L873DRAFT_132313 [Choiromyces venosus 120613-1]
MSRKALACRTNTDGPIHWKSRYDITTKMFRRTDRRTKPPRNTISNQYYLARPRGFKFSSSIETVQIGWVCREPSHLSSLPRRPPNDNCVIIGIIRQVNRGLLLVSLPPGDPVTQPAIRFDNREKLKEAKKIKKNFSLMTAELYPFRQTNKHKSAETFKTGQHKAEKFQTNQKFPQVS